MKIRRNGRQKRETTRFQLVSKLVMWLVLLSVLLAIALWISSANRDQAFFAIRSVTVEGNVHYDDEDIIGIGNVHPGQSVLTLNKNKVKNRIVERFAYIADVEVKQGKSFRDIVITVTEQKVFAAAYHDAEWLLIGMDGRLMEKRPVRSDEPERLMKLTLADVADNPKLGDYIISETDGKNIEKIVAACAEKGLADITALDVSHRGDLTFEWNNRLTVKLGNNSNVAHQIAVMAATLPKIDAKYGADSVGVLDLRSYSDPSSDDNYAIFTPSELITTTTYPLSTTTTTVSDTVTTTAKPR